MSVVMLNYELERIFKYLESEVEGEKRREDVEATSWLHASTDEV